MRGREEMGATGKGRRLNPRGSKKKTLEVGGEEKDNGWAGPFGVRSGGGEGRDLRFIFTDSTDGFDRLKRISDNG
jgi:hypothetical protein